MRRNASNTSNTETQPSSELEIEKKFPIPDANAAAKIEETLKSMGFQPVQNQEFVDWYFDLAAPNWYFSVRDCWIRYREKKTKMGGSWGWRGVWQVKQGRIMDEESHREGSGVRESDGMTSYKEYSGKVAKELILELLSKIEGLDYDCNIDDATCSFGDVYQGHDVPLLPGAERLVPFARFETRRSSWQLSEGQSSSFGGLKIDLDKTDFGYMVGEVEAVFEQGNDEAVIEAEKDKIRRLVERIVEEIDGGCENGDNLATIGKLEYYLMNNRQDHFDSLVQAGVMMT